MSSNKYFKILKRAFLKFPKERGKFFYSFLGQDFKNYDAFPGEATLMADIFLPAYTKDSSSGTMPQHIQEGA
jgi:hypothetical protein